MTVEWYDLGQRLHAATTGRLSARLVHAPNPAPMYPVVVRARTAASVIHVTAAANRDQAETTAHGPEALTMLHELGVRVTADHWRTLVTDTAETLTALAQLAWSADRDGPHAATAAHIAWWLDRADFPGTTAVIDTVAACRARWVTGTTPAAEGNAATWRHWLGVTTDSTHGLFAVLDQVTEGEPLPGIDQVSRADGWWWQQARADHTEGRDWRRPDSTARAALGLRARCATADRYAASLLRDPAYRRRAVHSGHVITGIVVHHPTNHRRIQITCDRLDARVRVGNDVTGWVGPPSGNGGQPFTGTVVAATVDGGRLVLDVAVGTTRPDPGGSVTLYTAPPNPHAAIRTDRAYAALYAERRSWLTTGRNPTPQRRDVPLDVLVAAAEQDSHA